MVTSKTTTGKPKKLMVKRETIKNLNAGKKANDVKGGMRPDRKVTRFCETRQDICA
jgi:hypothetical protein